MLTAKRILLLAAVLMGVFALSAAGVCAAEDDEEAQAEKEKAALDKKLAEIKAKKAAALNKDAPKDEKAAKASDNPFDQFKKDDGDAAAKPELPSVPKSGKTEKPDAKKSSALAAAAPAVPEGPCALCRGMKILPNLPYRAYTKFEGEAAPTPDFLPPWKICDKCQKGVDAKASMKEISEDMKARQERTRDGQKFWEDLTGKKFAQFETPFVVVRSNLPAATNTLIANALEKCAGILQANSKTMVLMATRPDEDQIVFIAEDASFMKYADTLGGDAAQKEMLKKGAGWYTAHQNVWNMGKRGAPAENRAVFAWGGIAMTNATDAKAKPWLREGFASYCENATLKQNLNYSIAYEMNQVKFGKNWNDDMKKMSKDGKLKPWGEIFEIQLEHLKAAEYQHCYSMVSFLAQIDPASFDKFVLEIKDGMDAGPALEKAYGKKVAVLQAAWGQWIGMQK